MLRTRIDWESFVWGFTAATVCGIVCALAWDLWRKRLAARRSEFSAAEWRAFLRTLGERDQRP